MFGFIIGTLSLIGLMRMMRYGGWHGRGGWHGGGGWGRQWMERRLFQHLDTTPGQEKVLHQAMEDVERQAWTARNAFLEARGQYARAMRAEPFDTAQVNEAFEKQQASVEAVKSSFKAGLQAVHEALTPEQRQRLADLMEFGPRAFRGQRGWYGRGGWGRSGHGEGRWAPASSRGSTSDAVEL